jgi:hypothetical protein
MNYFAHGMAHLDDPYVVAGTAVPDWLNVVNRRARARPKQTEPLLSDANENVTAIARGIMQHHHDDRWFHQSAAFTELSLQLTVLARDALAGDEGFRPSFMGHILVEILLDSVLIEEKPQQLDRYYAALSSIDPALVATTVERITGQSVSLLAPFIPRFIDERFLPDYLDDEKLLWRLNQVMRRVKLPALPAEFRELFPAARQQVATRKEELLTGPM